VVKLNTGKDKTLSLGMESFIHLCFKDCRIWRFMRQIQLHARGLRDSTSIARLARNQPEGIERPSKITMRKLTSHKLSKSNSPRDTKSW